MASARDGMSDKPGPEGRGERAESVARRRVGVRYTKVGIAWCRRERRKGRAGWQGEYV